MSVRQITLAWQAACETHTQKLALIALADNASDEGDCWPSISTIAQKCSLSRQGVIDQIRALEKMGIVSAIRCPGMVTKYHLNLVNRVDQSTALTSQPRGLPPVNRVDWYQSTALTGPVNAIDSNRKEPSVEPSFEPSVFSSEKKTKSVFSVPSVEMVAGYFTELEWHDPDALAHEFWDHHQANGWKLKAGMMKDWHAAARTWMRNARKFAKPGTMPAKIAYWESPMPQRTISEIFIDKRRELAARGDKAAIEILQKLNIPLCANTETPN